MPLYALAGQKRNGKDTLGAMLRDLDPSLVRRAFAHDVKRVVSETFGYSLDAIEEWKTRPEDAPGLEMPMRRVLQLVGDSFRTVDPDVWVRRALRDTTGVFCDVRYNNELRALASHGAVCVLVARSGARNADPSPSEACLRPVIDWFLASTEAPLVRVADLPQAPPERARMFHWFVRNDGSLEALRHAAERIVAEHSRSKEDDATRGPSAPPAPRQGGAHMGFGVGSGGSPVTKYTAVIEQ